MPKKKGRMDPASEAAIDALEVSRAAEAKAAADRETRERIIAETAHMAGRIVAAEMFSKYGDMSRLAWLKHVKDKKEYLTLGNWESFCKSIGLDRHTVDQDLANIAEFGEKFLVTVTRLGLGYRDLRRLRQIRADGTVIEITGETLLIGGETLPLTPDAKEDIQAAIEEIVERKDAEIEEAKAAEKAITRLLGDKEKVIHDQEKLLGRLEREARKRDLSPEEDAFLQQMENLRTSFDGYMLRIDPEQPFDGEMTPRMRAAFVTTLDYMRQSVIAAYDTAAVIHAIDLGDAEWNPNDDGRGK